MNRSFSRLLVSMALAPWVLLGCQHACRQPCPPTPPPPTLGSPFPAAGPASGFPTPSPTVPQAPPPPVPFPAATRSYEPPFAASTEPSWRAPAEGGVRLAAPEDAASAPPPGGARLQAPDFNPPSTPPPPLAGERPPTPALPAGIPQFAIAKDQVASGLKPMLDGVDWLKQNGYRGVLNLRQPGEDDTADRKLFEMRGLKYLSLELSPKTLSRAVLDEFSRVVDDRTNQPLFIYDKNGALVGSLWYLYFREAERQNDAEARTRAGRLGLREDQNGLQREMWLAIQKYLSEPAR